MKTKMLTAMFLLAILCWATYSNSLHNPFLMDDHALILDNPHLGDLSHLQLNPFAPQKGDAAGQDYIYFRPLTHLADFLSYSLYGRDARGYHLMNLCLFFVAGICWWHLLHTLFPKGPVALLGAAFFVTHPVFGVLINYTSTTGYILLILLTLLGFHLHLRFDESRRSPWLMGSVGCFCLSLLCHETAASFPFYLAGILYYFRQRSFRRTCLDIAPYIAVIFLYLLFRMFYASLKTAVIDNIGGFQLDPLQYAAAFYQLILAYLKNLLLLQDIVLIYSAPRTTHPLLITSLFLITALIISYLLLFRWRKDPHALPVWWLVAGLAPVTLACFSRPSMGLIISPHWLLVPSLGYCLFGAMAFSGLISSPRRSVGLGLAVFVLIAYISVSRYYNRLWGNEIHYCQYMLRLSPNIPLTKFWLAHAYAAQQDWESARRYFRETIMGAENDWKGYANLGVIEGRLGNTDREIAYYRKALQLKPDAPGLWNNLATAYVDRGEYQQAEAILRQVLKKYPEFRDAQINLEHLQKRYSPTTGRR